MFSQKILKLGGLSKIISKKKKQPLEEDKLQTGLPSNFSDEVFNLELEAEQQNVEMVVVNRLLELYAMAIEYYGNMQSDKCQIFKNKTRSLLMKQNVNDAMDKAQEILKSESNEEADILCIDPVLSKEGSSQMDDQIMKQRQKQLELNVKNIQQQDTQDSIRTLINSHSQDMLKNSKLIQQQKDIQTDQILQRLQRRRNKINGFDSDDSESKKPSSSQHFSHRKQSNSVDYKNDLGIDIVELSSDLPSHTKSRFVAYKPSILNSETNDLSNDTYQQQQFFSDLGQNDEDTSNFNQSSFFEQLPPPPSIPEQFSINNKETVSMFQDESSNAAMKPKKKKVRVSKKSALEFLQQHSAIPF